ncbi:unnamed protein product [Porites lobata]|uniref:Maturase K n=1 Tax=Porites lobata TaxID=104759 RepID=A0ABN8NHE1_9CNID|nr:unnamed protein product [Porites lobata]
MSRLVFRDPNQLRAGELHRHTPQWLSLIDDLNDDRFTEVRDWITNERQAFILLPHKKEKFIRLVKEILHRHCLDLLTLQRLSGKSMSMSLAVPGARLYVNEINLAVSGATRSSRPLKMSPALKKEIEHWLFLESWDGFLPWRSEKHTHVKLFSDSSHFAWGGALSPNAIEVKVYDYWDASIGNTARYRYKRDLGSKQRP